MPKGYQRTVGPASLTALRSNDKTHQVRCFPRRCWWMRHDQAACARARSPEHAVTHAVSCPFASNQENWGKGLSRCLWDGSPPVMHSCGKIHVCNFRCQPYGDLKKVKVLFYQKKWKYFSTQKSESTFLPKKVKVLFYPKSESTFLPKKWKYFSTQKSESTFLPKKVKVLFYPLISWVLEESCF